MLVQRSQQQAVFLGGQLAIDQPPQHPRTDPLGRFPALLLDLVWFVVHGEATSSPPPSPRRSSSGLRRGPFAHWPTAFSLRVVVGVQRGQLPPQPFSGPVEPGFYGRVADAQMFRNLVIIPLLRVLEEQDLSIPWR
jgi:hypothetical protein